MDRFTCGSVLRMRPNLDDRTLNLVMKHTYHNPYGDIRLSAAVLSFIDARVADQTTSQIFRELAASNIAGSESVVQHQVYYRRLCAESVFGQRSGAEVHPKILHRPTAMDLCLRGIYRKPVSCMQTHSFLLSAHHGSDSVFWPCSKAKVVSLLGQ